MRYFRQHVCEGEGRGHQPQTALRVQRFDLLSDSDPATWERVVGTIDLPAGTRYVVIEIFAFEDVADDATVPEFDGHFADDVTLVIRVAP